MFLKRLGILLLGAIILIIYLFISSETIIDTRKDPQVWKEEYDLNDPSTLPPAVSHEYEVTVFNPDWKIVFGIIIGTIILMILVRPTNRSNPGENG